jgi:hypothetical protein
MIARMSEDPEMKVCRYCGKQTSIHANFCYYCARELVARPERPMEEPKPARINWLVLGIAAGVVLVGIVLMMALR